MLALKPLAYASFDRGVVIWMCGLSFVQDDSKLGRSMRSIVFSSCKGLKAPEAWSVPGPLWERHLRDMLKGL
jgi:hypothetical protein